MESAKKNNESYRTRTGTRQSNGKLPRQKGVSISFADPYQKSIEIEGAAMKSIQLSSKIVDSMDCIVLLNDHENFDYAMIAAQNALVVDSRNGFKSFPRPNIIPL